MTVSHTFSENAHLYKTAVFKIPDAAAFIWRSMDDAHVIYDGRSGHSQVLNDFAREILALIEDAPCDVAQIYRELESILGRSLDEILQNQVLETLSEFDKMGLIEPVPAP